jgi:hypothetical protein
VRGASYPGARRQTAVGAGRLQVRSGTGQTGHVSLVSAASSLLMRSLPQSRPQDWAREILTTIGAAGRAVKAETLERMVDWMADKLRVDHWSVSRPSKLAFDP